MYPLARTSKYISLYGRVFIIMLAAILICVKSIGESNAAGASSLSECREISAPYDRYKIVVDDVKVVDTGSFSERKRVESAIRMQLDLLDYGVRHLTDYVFCTDRRPSARSFDHSMVDLLNYYGVILELWGEVSGAGSVLFYIVVPVRHYEFFRKSNNALTGHYRAEYGPRVGQDRTTALRELFGDAHELRAFVILALGIRFLDHARDSASVSERNRSYDNARTFFCGGLAALREARQHGLRGLNDVAWDALLRFAENSAQLATKEALADTSYSGALRLLPDEKLKLCAK
jgi:hypothetical protein